MLYFDEFDISFPPSFLQITSGVGIPLPPQENLTLLLSLRVLFEGQFIIFGRAKNNDDDFYQNKFRISCSQNYHKKTLFLRLIGHKPEQLTTRETGYVYHKLTNTTALKSGESSRLLLLAQKLRNHCKINAT